jgi:hypothetical protein
MEVLPLVLAAGEAVAQAVGVPFAAGLATEIVKSCEEVAKDKVSESPSFEVNIFSDRSNEKHARMLGNKSVQLLQALEEAEEEAKGLEGSKIQERIDEVNA